MSMVYERKLQQLGQVLSELLWGTAMTSVTVKQSLTDLIWNALTKQNIPLEPVFSSKDSETSRNINISSK